MTLFLFYSVKMVKRKIQRPALLFLALSLLAVTPLGRPAIAKDNPFPIPAGLESAVEFWKLIFTRYSGSEIVFYDSQIPTKIYKVLKVDNRRHLRLVSLGCRRSAN